MPLVDHRAMMRVTWRALADAGDGIRRLAGIATTPATDRMGDQVLPRAARFALPIPLLWQHDPERPIGVVNSATVGDDGIEITAEFRPTGNARLDAIIGDRWDQMKAGLVSFLSIGFNAAASKASKSGRVFTDWEMLEVSAVTIPANGECAITAVRAYPPAKCAARPRPNSATANPPGAIAMTTAERIAATKAAIVEMRDRLNALANVEDLDDTELSEMSELADSIEKQEKALAGLERVQALNAGAARPAGTALAARGTAAVPTAQRSQIVVARQREPVKGDLIFKALALSFLCHNEKASVSEMLEKHYRGNSELEVFMRATSKPADTTTPGWAAELVQTTIGDYIESLLAVSIYAGLLTRGGRFGFGRAGKVTLPYRANSSNDLAGNWILEGAPIPVKQTTIASKTLMPYKLAVISTFTRELAMHSTPEIEGLIRRYILEDTSKALDTYLLDNQPGTASRPAGLANGVTPITSAGAGIDNLIADVKAAVSAIAAAGGGRNLVWVMNPADAISVTFMTDAISGFPFADQMARGQFAGAAVIVSTNIEAGRVVLVDADSFVSALGDTPAFDVSDVATLHMEADPALVAPIVGGTPAAPVPAYPVRSLWQTASIGIRMIQDISWSMLRPGMVQVIEGVAW